MDASDDGAHGIRGPRERSRPPDVAISSQGLLGGVADLFIWRIWRICSAEALALSLLMLFLCRMWLLCVPDGAAAGVALAPGAAGAVCARADRGASASTAPTPSRAILLSIVVSSKSMTKRRDGHTLKIEFTRHRLNGN